MTIREYEVGISFATKGVKRPIHAALGSMAGVVIRAASIEEAEAQADQIRSALEDYANGIARMPSPSLPETLQLMHHS